MLRSVTFTFPKTKFKYNLGGLKKHTHGMSAITTCGDTRTHRHTDTCTNKEQIVFFFFSDGHAYPFFFGKYASISKKTCCFSLIWASMSFSSSDCFSSDVKAHLPITRQIVSGQNANTSPFQVKVKVSCKLTLCRCCSNSPSAEEE